MNALIVIDVQRGFADSSYWGERDNPAFEGNLARLLDAWREREQPIVVVRHDSRQDGSPLRAGTPGNALTERVAAVDADVLVTKHVNSAFIGEPDLDAWLREHGIDAITLCGIQTNMCVETTARMGGNLGYDVTVAIDACHTFGLSTALGELTAAELSRATAVNLTGGGFARVRSVDDVLAAVPA